MYSILGGETALADHLTVTLSFHQKPVICNQKTPKDVRIIGVFPEYGLTHTVLYLFKYLILELSGT